MGQAQGHVDVFCRRLRLYTRARAGGEMSNPDREPSLRMRLERQGSASSDATIQRALEEATPVAALFPLTNLAA